MRRSFEVAVAFWSTLEVMYEHLKVCAPQSLPFGEANVCTHSCHYGIFFIAQIAHVLVFAGGRRNDYRGARLVKPDPCICLAGVHHGRLMANEHSRSCIESIIALISFSSHPQYVFLVEIYTPFLPMISIRPSSLASLFLLFLSRSLVGD